MTSSLHCEMVFTPSRMSFLLIIIQCVVFKVRYLITIKVINGDNEIRTRDPLLARQVLSQLSYAPMGIYFVLIWQPPAFPCRLQHSIIGRLGLNHRVRDVNGCDP